MTENPISSRREAATAARPAGRPPVSTAGVAAVVAGESARVALEEGVVVDRVIAESGAEAKELWRVREAIVEAQNYSDSIKCDVAVPVSRVAEFINRATLLVTERL